MRYPNPVRMNATVAADASVPLKLPHEIPIASTAPACVTTCGLRSCHTLRPLPVSHHTRVRQQHPDCSGSLKTSRHGDDIESYTHTEQERFRCPESAGLTSAPLRRIAPVGLQAVSRSSIANQLRA